MSLEEGALYSPDHGSSSRQLQARVESMGQVAMEAHTVLDRSAVAGYRAPGLTRMAKQYVVWTDTHASSLPTYDHVRTARESENWRNMLTGWLAATR